MGLHRVYEDILDHMLDTPQYGSSRASPRDTFDLGSALPLRGSPSQADSASGSPPAELHTSLQHRTSSYLNLNLMNTQLVLSFYTSLVRLLAYCAPVDEDRPQSGGTGTGNSLSGGGSANGPFGTTDGHSGSSNGTAGGTGGCSAGSNLKKSGAERTRNILRNLISVGDVRGILSLQFARDGRPGIVPAHKEAALLFLSRVYGVTESQLLRDLLTDAFLPDIKTALKLGSVSVNYVLTLMDDAIERTAWLDKYTY